MKNVLIIGGSGGIGLETAKVLKVKGFNPIIGYNNSKMNFGEFESYKMDVTNKESLNTALSKIREKHKIDCVIFSVASKLNHKTFELLSWEEFEKHLNIQLKGFFNTVKEFSEEIRSRNKIKFITILTEYCFGKPPIRLSDYISSKYALMGLTKSLASEYSNTRATFNMVSPGITQTDLLSNLPEKFIELSVSKHPMNKIAETRDIANVISFLVSEDSDYINGENLLVNGGSNYR